MKNLIIIIALALTPQFLSGQLIDYVVATVNGELITASDLTAFKKQFKRGVFANDLTIKSQNIKNRKNLLEALIHQKILDSEVKKQNLTISPDRINAEMKLLAKNNNMTQKQFKKFLKKRGFQLPEYKNFLKQQLERQALIEKFISPKIKISESDITSYYIEHYGTGKNETFEYRIAHILFLPKRGNVKAAKARSLAVLKKLKSGEKSFSELAAQYSEDPTFSPGSGGLLGEFKSGEALPAIDKTIRSMRAYQTSDIVRSQVGFHILKLLNKKIVSSPKFEKEKPHLRKMLYQKSLEQHFSLWLQEKKSDSFIHINKQPSKS